MDLPPHLHATRDLLMRSLPVHVLEQAPPMPAGLASDLLSRFEPRAARMTITAPASFFGKLRAFLATPGFGMAATAVVVLGLGIPLLSNKEPESFRGDNPPSATASEGTAICFVGRNKTLQAAIEKSGNFEVSAFRSAATSDAALTLAGPKVLVDFTTDTITAYDAAGKVVHTLKFPDQSSRVAGAVADAVSRASQP
jgi:hypothetical protein